MVDYIPERIVGPRLLLRPPVLDDAGPLFQRVARDPQVTKHLLWTPHPDVATTRLVITQRLNVGDDERTWVIALRHSDEIIGLASCRRPVRHSVEPGSCWKAGCPGMPSTPPWGPTHATACSTPRRCAELDHGERRHLHAVLGEHPEAFLHPVIHAEPGIGRATRSRHGR